MLDFLAIIGIVFGVLQIILFFKIWGMTSDTKKIREMENLRNRLTFFQKLPSKCTDFRGEVFYVRGIYEDKILCARNENDENILEFKANEINFIAD